MFPPSPLPAGGPWTVLGRMAGARRDAVPGSWVPG
jgi:hypothetical protein